MGLHVVSSPTDFRDIQCIRYMYILICAEVDCLQS